MDISVARLGRRVHRRPARRNVVRVHSAWVLVGVTKRLLLLAVRIRDRQANREVHGLIELRVSSVLHRLALLLRLHQRVIEAVVKLVLQIRVILFLVLRHSFGGLRVRNREGQGPLLACAAIRRIVIDRVGKSLRRPRRRRPSLRHVSLPTIHGMLSSAALLLLFIVLRNRIQLRMEELLLFICETSAGRIPIGGEAHG